MSLICFHHNFLSVGEYLDITFQALKKAKKDDPHCSFPRLCSKINSSKSTVNRYRRLHLLRVMSRKEFEDFVHTANFLNIKDVADTPEKKEVLDVIIK